MPYDAEDQKIQIMLAYLGYSVGALDGIIGRNTRAAIAHFQENYGLEASGEADSDTFDALHGAFMEGNYTMSGVVLQLLLHFAGYDPGTIDGIVGRNTRAAIESFQEDMELEVTGKADDADTIYALKEQLYAGC